MNFLFITDQELSALAGLPYLQQVAYLTGIRPYMDRNTFTVGIKRRISYQSLAEALYVEPSPGITSSGSPSRQQLRRVIKALERSGLIHVQSDHKNLILKCLLVHSHYSVQNKADTNPTPQPNTVTTSKNLYKPGENCEKPKLPDTGRSGKADTPHNSINNFVFLREKFEEFWAIYPQAQEQAQAWQVFKRLNPSAPLFAEIMAGLNAQIEHREALLQSGEWVPFWKFPANWLAHQSWKVAPQDLGTKGSKEKLLYQHRRKSAVDVLVESCKDASFDFDE